jgi:hypothetical protein
MGNLKRSLMQQGGVRLIKDFLRAGVLSYAIAQILLTGFKKKSLEILRLGAQQKIFGKLKRKYWPLLKSFDKTISSSNLVNERNNKVWVFWMQGIENAPPLVQRCYRSLQENLKDREIVLITEKNIGDYVQFPDYIMDKLNKGYITYTHLSDLLRVELLIRYGGTWIDSTVFCSGSKIPDYMLNSDFFVFQNLRPGDNGSVLNFSSWLMTSCKNNRILLATRELLYAYWKKNNYLIDYFLVHHFVMIGAEYYKEDWKRIVQFPNSLPHVLLLMLFEPFNQEKWDAVSSACPFHKLAYKRSKEEMEKEGTYYRYIMEK